MEGVDVGELWEGLRMDTDLGFGFLLRARFGRGVCRPSHTKSLGSHQIRWRQASPETPPAPEMPLST